MKHAGSSEDFRKRLGEPGPKRALRRLWRDTLRRQSAPSLLICLAGLLFLVAILLDPVALRLARGMDPSQVAALRLMTRFGNAAWPLCLCLGLLGVIALLVRRPATPLPDGFATLRATLILQVMAVALSGVLASLTKHAIGRIRPSADAGAEVFQASLLAFQYGWAAFPSGHATTATASALALAICFPRMAWAWMSIGLLAALSRAFLGVHWLSDCVAGIVLGTAVTLVLCRAMEALGHVFRVPPGVLGRMVVIAGQDGWRRLTALSRLDLRRFADSFIKR
ncbi:MAG: phosphatase PAP2 family protein [Gemmobacter sp.]|uniref:phosphatase PAP2 family protein n=1 Tax=Gemmobacter sp. TaxID=1898957 RepID=UPI00391A2861